MSELILIWKGLFLLSTKIKSKNSKKLLQKWWKLSKSSNRLWLKLLHIQYCRNKKILNRKCNRTKFISISNNSNNRFNSNNKFSSSKMAEMHLRMEFKTSTNWVTRHLWKLVFRWISKCNNCKTTSTKWLKELNLWTKIKCLNRI